MFLHECRRKRNRDTATQSYYNRKQRTSMLTKQVSGDTVLPNNPVAIEAVFVTTFALCFAVVVGNRAIQLASVFCLLNLLCRTFTLHDAPGQHA